MQNVNRTTFSYDYIEDADRVLYVCNFSIDIFDSREEGNFLREIFLSEEVFWEIIQKQYVNREYDVIVDSNGQKISTFFVMNNFRPDEYVKYVLQKVREL